MAAPQNDRERAYLDALARQLEDPDAYLRFLAAKLDRQGEVVESGVRPVDEPATDPVPPS